MFTPEVRKALYALLTAVLGVFAAFNVISADQASQYADAATQIVGALTLALATYHTHPAVTPPVRARPLRTRSPDLRHS